MPRLNPLPTFAARRATGTGAHVGVLRTGERQPHEQEKPRTLFAPKTRWRAPISPALALTYLRIGAGGTRTSLRGAAQDALIWRGYGPFRKTT